MTFLCARESENERCYLTEIDHDQLQRKLLARNDMRDRRRFLQDVLQAAPQPQGQLQSKNPRGKVKKEEYTVVSPTSNARESELTQTLPSSTLKQMKQFRMVEKSGKVAPAPPAKPSTGKDGKNKPLPVPPVKKKPVVSTKEAPVEPSKSPAASDKRNNPLPPTPQESSRAQAGGGSTPKSGRPKLIPRTGASGKTVAKSPSSPTQSPSVFSSGDRNPSGSSSTSLSPPPSEQAVYMNTDFSSTRGKDGGRGKKKSPVPPPTSLPRSVGHTPSTLTSDPELDVGGQDVYENTEFGDTSESGDLYANVPVSQQRKGQTHNGHPHHHKSTIPPYQNVSHDQSESPDSGSTYQNIHFPSRGRRRK